MAFSCAPTIELRLHHPQKGHGAQRGHNRAADLLPRHSARAPPSAPRPAAPPSAPRPAPLEKRMPDRKMPGDNGGLRAPSMAETSQQLAATKAENRWLKGEIQRLEGEGKRLRMQLSEAREERDSYEARERAYVDRKYWGLG